MSVKVIDSQTTLDNLNKAAELAQAYHVPNWLIATLFVSFVIVVIVIATFAFGWRYIKPVLDWVRTYKESDTDLKRAKVWENIESIKTSLETNNEKNDQRFEKLENNIEIIKSSQNSLETRMSKHENILLKHSNKIQFLEEKSEIFMDRKKMYEREQVELAIKVEHALDDWLFDEFWSRLLDIGRGNYDTVPVYEMFDSLIKEATKKGVAMKIQKGLSSNIQKVMGDAEIPVNEYAFLFFEKFLMVYQDRTISPRLEHLKLIVESCRTKYKSLFKDEFVKLIKLIING